MIGFQKTINSEYREGGTRGYEAQKMVRVADQ